MHIFLFDLGRDLRLHNLLEVEDGIDQVVEVILHFLNHRAEVRALKQELLVLVEQIVYIHSVLVHRHVLHNELFVQEL